MLRWAYWPFAAQFYVTLFLTPQRVRDAAALVRSIFDETDRRLSDGRRYLVGDTFTLSDLALAATAAALLLPEGYESPMPPPDTMPPEMVSMRAELDQRETGRFVRRIYRDHRLGHTAPIASGLDPLVRCRKPVEGIRQQLERLAAA